MAFDLIIDGIPVPSNRWSGPQGLSIAYRGPEPGVREYGSVSFNLYGPKLNEPWLDACVVGAPVLISLKGRVIFRGEVCWPLEDRTPLKYTLVVNAKELSAAVGDADAMRTDFDGMACTDGFIWMGDCQAAVPVGQVVKGLQVRLDSSFSGVIDRMGYEKKRVSDRYLYVDGGSPVEGAKFRTMIWQERSVEQIIADLQLEGITGIEVDLSEEIPEAAIPIKDESGNAVFVAVANNDTDPPILWNYSFETRAINATGLDVNATFLWIQRSEAGIDVYQVVNHGLAKKLGSFAAVQSDFKWLNQYGGHAGPVAVQSTIINNDWGGLAVYWESERSGHDTYGDYLQVRAVVYEIMLDQAADQDGNLLAGRYHRVEEKGYGWTHGCVRGSNGSFHAGNGAGDIIRVSNRAGGQYRMRENSGNLLWQGDSWLRQFAYDFQDQTARDVLREMCLLAGAEWWVDANGTLHVERLNRATAAVSVRSRRIFEDYVTYQQPPDPFASIGNRGIPTTDYCTALLSAQLSAQWAETGSERRVIKFLPDRTSGEVRLPLGAALTLDDEAVGRIVAVKPEPNGEVVTVELESEV